MSDIQQEFDALALEYRPEYGTAKEGRVFGPGFIEDISDLVEVIHA